LGIGDSPLAAVIASEAKQSSVAPRLLDCFVASLLAMTKTLDSRLRGNERKGSLVRRIVL